MKTFYRSYLPRITSNLWMLKCLHFFSSLFSPLSPSWSLQRRRPCHWTSSAAPVWYVGPCARSIAPSVTAVLPNLTTTVPGLTTVSVSPALKAGPGNRGVGNRNLHRAFMLSLVPILFHHCCHTINKELHHILCHLGLSLHLCQGPSCSSAEDQIWQ